MWTLLQYNFCAETFYFVSLYTYKERYFTISSKMFICVIQYKGRTAEYIINVCFLGMQDLYL